MLELIIIIPSAIFGFFLAYIIARTDSVHQDNYEPPKEEVNKIKEEYLILYKKNTTAKSYILKLLEGDKELMKYRLADLINLYLNNRNAN